MMKETLLNQLREDVKGLINNFTTTDMLDNFRVSTNNKDAYIIKKADKNESGVERYNKFSIYELTHIKDFYAVNEKAYELSFKIFDENNMMLSSYKMFIFNSSWYTYNNYEVMMKDITKGDDFIIDNDIFVNVQILTDMIARTHVVQMEKDEFKIARNLINTFNVKKDEKIKEEIDPSKITNSNGTLDDFKWRSLFKYIRKQ